jgi:hypothetical protein
MSARSSAVHRASDLDHSSASRRMAMGAVGDNPAASF